MISEVIVCLLVSGFSIGLDWNVRYFHGIRLQCLVAYLKLYLIVEYRYARALVTSLPTVL